MNPVAVGKSMLKLQEDGRTDRQPLNWGDHEVRTNMVSDQISTIIAGT